MSTTGDSDGSWTVCGASSDRYGQYVYYVSRYGPTQVLQFGLQKPVTDVGSEPLRHVRRIIFFIPGESLDDSELLLTLVSATASGNPGVITMYHHFLSRLHQSLGVPVVGLSHVGQIREGISRSKEPITVRKQVEHKLDFIENVVPDDVEIVLMGHSIGTFMAVQVMRLLEKRERVVHTVMLMPVLEKFTQSPGWKSLSLLLPFRFLAFLLVFLLSFVKDEIVLQLIPRLVPDMKRSRTPVCVLEGTLQLVNYRVFSNMLALARDESCQVDVRDDLFLSKNLHKMSFFFCADDRWVPLTFLRNLKRRFPSAQTELMDTVCHAFVVDKRMTEEVISRVATLLRTQLTASDGDMD